MWRAARIAMRKRAPRRQSRDPRLLDRQPGAAECKWSHHPVSSRATAGMPTVVQDYGVGGRSGRETQMDWSIIEGKWKELKGHAREQWGKLSDLSLIHISEPTRLGMISYAVFCLK